MDRDQMIILKEIMCREVSDYMSSWVKGRVDDPDLDTMLCHFGKICIAIGSLPISEEE